MRPSTPHRNFFPASSAASSSCGSSTGESQTPPSSPPPPPRDRRNKKKAKTGFAKLVDENAIVIVSIRECFMCIAVKCLLVELGVNPVIFRVDATEKTLVLQELSKIKGRGNRSNRGGPWELPAIYIGGKYVGGVDQVMGSHIKGELVPMLIEAGALSL